MFGSVISSQFYLHRLARWLYRRIMRRGLKKEMVVEEEGEVGEVFTISREGLGEGGQVQVEKFLS